MDLPIKYDALAGRGLALRTAGPLLSLGGALAFFVAALDV